MKFSVIIPVYNVGQYLHECVNSVLTQTFSDYEVILVDDGSLDDSPRICDELAEKHDCIQVIHQNNAGLSCARNAALPITRGEYICYLDGDDYWLNGCFLEALSLKTENHPDIICYGIQKYYESDSSWGKAVVPSFETNNDLSQVISTQLRDGSFSVSASTKAVRRAFLIKNDINFRQGLIGEDSDWYFSLLFHHPSIECLSLKVVAYRQRKSSIVHTINLKGFTDNLWILDYWTKQIQDRVNNIDEKKSLLSIGAYLYANLLIVLSWQEKQNMADYLPRVESKRWLLKYAQSKRALIIRAFIMILGVRLTIELLTILSRLKKRL